MTSLVSNISSETLLGDAMFLYLKVITPLKKGRNQENYRAKPLICYFKDIALRDITPVHVATYRDKRLAAPHPKTPKKTISASTVKLEMMLLSHLFTVASTEWGVNIDNPVTKVRKPKASPGRNRRLSLKENSVLLRKASAHQNKELYPIIVLALETAMRQGEILSLQWEHISWKKKVAHLPHTKNGSMRDVPLSMSAIHILKNVLKPKQEGRIFQYSQAGIKSTWRCLTKAAGITDLHFHDLRHEAISRLFEKGLDVMEVSTISGHKSLSMLKRYTHLNAYKLVAKLDPKKKRKKDPPRELKDFLVAYPAMVEKRAKSCSIHFFDFIDIQVKARDYELAMEAAKNKLLRKIITTLNNGEIPVSPTEDVDGIEVKGRDEILLIHPLF